MMIDTDPMFAALAAIKPEMRGLPYDVQRALDRVSLRVEDVAFRRQNSLTEDHIDMLDEAHAHLSTLILWARDNLPNT